MNEGNQYSQTQDFDNDISLNSPGKQQPKPVFVTKLPWRSLFFFAALVSLVASITMFIGSFYHVGLLSEPASFIDDAFYVLFSVVMVVIELPYRGWEWQDCVCEFIDRFVQFLTRFTGRGFWYMFLGTMVWVGCWDEGANEFQFFVAVTASSYLCLLGLVSFVKGIRLSCRLNRVKESVQQQGGTSQDYFSSDSKPMCKEYFRALFEQHDESPVSDLEIEFALNAISERFDSKDTMTSDEFDEWLKSPKSLFLV